MTVLWSTLLVVAYGGIVVYACLGLILLTDDALTWITQKRAARTYRRWVDARPEWEDA
jgi:hypothetical protein